MSYDPRDQGWPDHPQPYREEDGDFSSPDPDPDFDSMSDEEFEAYLVEKRAQAARRHRFWMELVNREVRR